MGRSARTIFSAASLLILLPILSSIGRSSSAGFGGPKNVHVSLRAKWSGTPLLLEAGYFVRSSFFKLQRFKDFVAFFIFYPLQR